MSKFDKVLTPKYLNWYIKLSELSSVLMNKIHSKLYKKYKKKTEYELCNYQKFAFSQI